MGRGAAVSAPSSPAPSWYFKLRAASSKRAGGSAPDEDDTIVCAMDDGKKRKMKEKVSPHSKPISDLEVAAMVASHLSSSRKEPVWEREFSSMSSCRSDPGSTTKAAAREEDEEDEELLPPLLRNPHIAEFDVVEDWSSSTSGDEQVEDHHVPTLKDDDQHQHQRQNQQQQQQQSLRRKNHNDNSFSACLPAEIKGVVADSIPLVKYSHDPYRDFSDSMFEMIREKQLRCWADLEELLFCYLSLNSPEHHAVIKQSFSDVWHHLTSPTR